MPLNGKPSFCITQVSERDFIDNEQVKNAPFPLTGGLPRKGKKLST